MKGRLPEEFSKSGFLGQANWTLALSGPGFLECCICKEEEIEKQGKNK
jgi:hypothetical protein